MATIREILDLGFTTDPQDAAEQDAANLWARALYRVLGRDGSTKFGTALALEPVIMTGVAVAGNQATIPVAAGVCAVEATAGGSKGPKAITLVTLAAGRVKVTLGTGGCTLTFDAADAVTECAVLYVAAPAALTAALAERLE